MIFFSSKKVGYVSLVLKVGHMFFFSENGNIHSWEFFGDSERWKHVHLVGGFKDFYFHAYLEKISNLTNIF